MLCFQGTRYFKHAETCRNNRPLAVLVVQVGGAKLVLKTQKRENNDRHSFNWVYSRGGFITGIRVMVVVGAG